MDKQEFEAVLREIGLPAEKVSHFRDLVLAENEAQNLTRLTSPRDFLEGHVLDAVELLKSGLVQFPAMDLGSGAGVPGLLAAILGSGPWVLAESEGRKAGFLSRAVEELGLDVQVFSGRAEEYLRKERVQSIVARAVGPVGRIMGWVGRCSTWNNLVLMKGPAWEDEWQEFSATPAGRKLRIAGQHAYTVGAESKRRLIIRLARSA